MVKKLNHQQRIKQELEASGVTSYGMHKMESRSLHTQVGEDEHVMGVAYGKGHSGSAMLVATDKRVIYFDQKPFFSISDHLSYDAISGVELSQSIGYAHIILHSRAGDYTIRFANIACARQFADYIDFHQSNILPDKNEGDHKIFRSVLSSKSANRASDKVTAMNLDDSALDDEAYNFLRLHELGVIATVNRTNALHAAAVYYSISEKGIIHILTKSKTNKARDIISQQLVALAVYDEQTLETVQLEARAELETDVLVIKKVYTQITRSRKHGSTLKKPPVLSVNKGDFVVIRLTPVLAKYSKF